MDIVGCPLFPFDFFVATFQWKSMAKLLQLWRRVAHGSLAE